MNEKNKQLIKSLISENIVNGEKYIKNRLKNRNITKYRDEFNEIKIFVDNFIEGNVHNRFIVLPGIRGVGKTTILFQTYEYLTNVKNIPNNQILYISCEDVNNVSKCNIREFIEIYLENYFDSTLLTLENPVFLLIDEVQYDTEWATSGKIIYDKCDNVFMIFTGSSALNLEYNADAARRLIKTNINPLTYSQYLNLKYNLDLKIGKNPIIDLIFHGNVEDAIKYEKKVNNILINCENYLSNDWIKYLKYGGFPSLLYENNKSIIINQLVHVINRVIDNDMRHIKDFSLKNQANANRILRFLTLQKPGEISQANLSNYLETSIANVKSIIDALEKTHLIFHTEPFSSSSNRIKKSWKYYFATSSLRNALSIDIGNPVSENHLEGILLEDLIASHLHYLSYYDKKYFKLYYDANKKKNVDFLIHNGVNKVIPIEVSKGKKDKRQITDAIKRYNSDYGIIIADNEPFIKKEDNVIFLPFKTFSYI